MDTTFLTQGIFIILIISGIPLILSAACLLILAFLQTITQMQEQSLTYVVKCLVVFATFYFCFGYFYDLITNFFNGAFLEVVKLGNLS